MFSLKSKVSATAITRLLDRLGALLLKHNLVIDSRKIKPGDIFAAYPGTITDGRDYIAQAINGGAQYILYEEGQKIPEIKNVPNMAVNDLAQYVGILAAHKYANPTDKFKTVGVTGTNGKTSITHWLNQAYSKLGNLTAIIGTTGAGVYPAITDYKMTTPDPITLESLLGEFASAQIQLLAMEVSSHALHQGRVNGIQFDFAVWTNLTQDHLDYHETMENYYLAKCDLFYWDKLKYAVINTDDKYGNRLYSEIKTSNLAIHTLSYGVERGDLQASEIKISLAGTTFKLSYADETEYVQVKLIGKFNVYNLLAVAGVLLLDGYKLKQVATILAELKPVPGRMETVILPNKPLVVVDYAHTPDALDNVLKTLQETECAGKVYCVFGCGGDRDAKKRPIMGKIVAELADFAIVTSDNPRNENPEAIIAEIIKGIPTNTKYRAITNRKDAIAQALKLAGHNDIVLIAGKGHETYQEICGVRENFSDIEIARDYLKDYK